MKRPDRYRKQHPVEHLLKQTGSQYYVIPHNKTTGMIFTCIAYDGIAYDGPEWQHVGVVVSKINERPVRCATWDEMCYVKSLFWSDDEAVMQLHPPKSEWISNHPTALHLWKPVKLEIPLPPSSMVGLKELNGKF